jgi:hypothetical protein
MSLQKKLHVRDVELLTAIAQLLANNVPGRKAWTSAVTVQNSPAPNFCLALTGLRVYLTTSKSTA